MKWWRILPEGVKQTLIQRASSLASDPSANMGGVTYGFAFPVAGQEWAAMPLMTRGYLALAYLEMKEALAE